MPRVCNIFLARDVNNLGRLTRLKNLPYYLLSICKIIKKKVSELFFITAGIMGICSR